MESDDLVIAGTFQEQERKNADTNESKEDK